MVWAEGTAEGAAERGGGLCMQKGHRVGLLGGGGEHSSAPPCPSQPSWDPGGSLTTPSCSCCSHTLSLPCLEPQPELKAPCFMTKLKNFYS